MASKFIACCALAAALAACSGGGGAPAIPPVPGGSTAGATVYDRSSTACAVSYEGVIWYRVPAGTFPPIDVKSAQCGASSLASDAAAPRPSWSIPHGPTQARFVATSLTSQQGVPLTGMQSIEAAAQPLHVPVSWLIYNTNYIDSVASINRYRASNGDDAEGNSDATLLKDMRRDFRWFVPAVSVEGASHERNIAGLTALGMHAFWGITWNSHGIDGTWDYGAPWGSYCADPSSYKRPDPTGKCRLLAFEWTARDLTRAYLSGHEEYFSTDPDDLQQRAQFSAAQAETYVRELADGYAAAGETQPIVMMSQQESQQNTTPGDAPILAALYDQAVRDGMKTENFAAAEADAMTFSAAPRAVAFPFLPGGVAMPSSILNGQTLYPATIDYHDSRTGMTFLAGHALPTRIFRYSDDPVSHYNQPLASLPASLFPTLEKAAVDRGTLALELQAPVALHVGVALWSDPRKLGITQSGAIPAGRAGEVIVFDLQAGTNQVRIRCPGCKSPTLPYSL